MKKSEQIRFYRDARQLFEDCGAELIAERAAGFDRPECPHCEYTISTDCGQLRISFHGVRAGRCERNDSLGAVFTRFDDHTAAYQVVDCNPYSGKWNHHYFGRSAADALADLARQLAKVGIRIVKRNAPSLRRLEQITAAAV